MDSSPCESALPSWACAPGSTHLSSTTPEFTQTITGRYLLLVQYFGSNSSILPPSSRISVLASYNTVAVGQSLSISTRGPVSASNEIQDRQNPAED